MVKARERSPTASLEGFSTTNVFGAIGPIKVTDLTGAAIGPIKVPDLTGAAIVAERTREKALLTIIQI